jgi:hypothetical protein
MSNLESIICIKNFISKLRTTLLAISVKIIRDIHTKARFIRCYDRLPNDRSSNIVADHSNPIQVPGRLYPLHLFHAVCSYVPPRLTLTIGGIFPAIQFISIWQFRLRIPQCRHSISDRRNGGTTNWSLDCSCHLEIAGSLYSIWETSQLISLSNQDGQLISSYKHSQQLSDIVQADKTTFRFPPELFSPKPNYERGNSCALHISWDGRLITWYPARYQKIEGTATTNRSSLS